MNKMIQIENQEYNRIFQAANSKVYEEAVVWIGQMARPLKDSPFPFDENYFYYCLDEKGTQIIRINSKTKTIELTVGVNPEIVEAISHMISTEIRGSDSVI